MITFGSMFAGIGGFDLGFERAGMSCTWAVEIDPKCRRVLSARFPNSKLHKDVRKVGKKNLCPVDVVCGGVPCQDVSLAGSRLGMAGERTSLFREFLRVVRELRPRALVIENVPGLLSSWSTAEAPPIGVQARDFDSREEAERWAQSLEGQVELEESCDLGGWLADIQELGYRWQFCVLDSQYFGLAQRRDRVFIVGCLGDLGGLEILFEPTSVLRDSPPSRETGQSVAGTVTRSLGIGVPDSAQAENGLLVAEPLSTRPYSDRGPDGNLIYAIQEAATRENLSSGPGGCGYTDGGIAYTLEARPTAQAVAYPVAGEVAHTLTGDMQRLDPSAETLIVAFDERVITSPGNRSSVELGDPSPTLADHHHGPAIAIRTAQTSANGHGVSEDLAHTLDRAEGQAIAQGFVVRRLTPLECVRLQGFPDSWLDIDPPLSDSTKYKMCGNAVSVPVAEWIGSRLVAVLLPERVA